MKMQWAAFVFVFVLAGFVHSEPPEVAPPPRPAKPKLDLKEFLAKPTTASTLIVRRYEADFGSLSRAYPVPFSDTRIARMRKFHCDWLTALKGLDLENQPVAVRDELASLRARVESELKDLETKAVADQEILPLVPFAKTVASLEETRRRMEPIDPIKAAGQVAELVKVIEKAKANLGTPSRGDATKAASATERLRTSLKTWFSFYDAYDPMFTWWLAQPYKQADAALEGYAKFLRDKTSTLSEAKPDRPTPTLPAAESGTTDTPKLDELLARTRSEMIPVLQQYMGGNRGFRGAPAGDPAAWLAALKELDFDKLSPSGQIDYVLLRVHLEHDLQRRDLRNADRPVPPKDDTGINGRPIGRAAMLAELAVEMVPYSPEELVALARKEYAWCEAEIKDASRKMGFGDDWKKAVEKVKTLHVAPGGQPKLIRELSDEAVAYLKKHDLVTVPPLAAETWRMEMMSPDRQLVSPFFTGGEVISVAFPTNTMSHDAKLQSLRGNNAHFSRATVHHELIPGHHLQQFMNTRENTYRGAFGTTMWTEGWAVYWEMVLYARGFPATPEDRIGFLVWRMHRCARVMFSLGYHLGQLTPRQCIDLLIDKVGFEPDNATAEVRRSFTGGYGPMYQAGYLIGAMQFRALRHELVDTGKMKEKDFHDAILQENRIPVELLRAKLSGQKLTADHVTKWKYGGIPDVVP